MLRTVLGVIAGVLAGIVVVSGIELINYRLYPAPPDLMTNPDALATWIGRLPTSAFLVVLAAQTAGGFVATTTALLIARRRRLAGWIAGGFLVAATIYNAITVPGPTWMSIAAVMAVPAAVLAAQRLFGPAASA